MSAHYSYYLLLLGSTVVVMHWLCSGCAVLGLNLPVGWGPSVWSLNVLPMHLPYW